MHYLARFPVETARGNRIDQHCHFQYIQMTVLEVTPEIIAIEHIRNRALIKTIWIQIYEFTFQEDCILRDTSVIILQNLRVHIKKELHSGLF